MGDSCTYDLFVVDDTGLEQGIFMDIDATSEEFEILQLDLSPASAYLSKWPAHEKLYCDCTFYKRDVTELLEDASMVSLTPMESPVQVVFRDTSSDCEFIDIF